ncbi:RhuM family protein [Marinobacter sp.]|jgi:virulence RhuM family protein|uniref:virulence RhuM family protein n=1 Tax=Marinobacter sp. TaxID=50741 RepID=UPI0025C1E2FC|nr:RhuM family protein [Marinobacter sp.]|tara:strand:- start:1274 stop:1897 length:624 start_codon:yes stop_codon:yes gene_type:complete
MSEENSSPIVIYENADHAVEVRLDAGQGTLWLTQAQMGTLFCVKPQNITMHLKNIYAEGELVEAATCKDFLQVQSEGGREVKRKRKHYSMDAVISVGYRISSARATQFRIWATRILREHLTQGWTLNRQRFEENAQELEAALTLVRKAAQSPSLDTNSGRGLVDIVSRYAQTFLLLQRYDEGLLTGERRRLPQRKRRKARGLVTLSP